jgi:kynurenine formamidase
MIVDLSMSISDETPILPGQQKQKMVQIANIEKDGWNEKRISFNSHFSTHIDAPHHMIKNGKKLTDFPIEVFIGEAIVLDVREQRAIRADLSNVKSNDIVFFFTGYNNRIISKSFYRDNPVISMETAFALVEMKVRVVGLDSFSPDNAPFKVHHLLLQHDILIVENLVNLEQLNFQRFMCYILPLKIQDADGAPCRVIGIL